MELKIAKFAPSTLERAFSTFTTVIFEKVEKGRISGIHEEGHFLCMYVFSISRAFRKLYVVEVAWMLRWRELFSVKWQNTISFSE